MQPVNIKLKWVNKIVIAILFVLLFYNSFAQPPTKAESDKIMKEAQERIKKYGNDSARVKALQHLLDQQKKITDAMKNQPQNNNGSANKSSNADPGEYSNVDNWKFPAKNIAMLSSLPKKLLTRIELVNFLNEVYNGLAKKLSPGISSSVQSITAKCNNDGNRMGDVAVAGWYTNYREESLLLIIKAAATNPVSIIITFCCY